MNLVEPHIASLFGLHLPPIVALFLTVAFIVFLFRRDFRENPNVTGALWLPLLWMVIVCSRPVSQWLDMFGVHLGGTSLEEGSALDACLFFGPLIAAGIYVLNKRQVRLAEIVQNNGWLIAFLLYCFISIVWSDFPFVAFKRWIKTLGNPIMVLIVFTEPDLEEAFKRLMKRCAYVIVPVSILLIKYYPEWGRGYDAWTGMAMSRGIAQGKNMLGADCLLLGFFFFWQLLNTWRSERSRARRNELLLIGGFLFMILWLFREAHSTTSLVSLLVGIVVIGLLGLRFVNKRVIGIYLLAAIFAIAVAELAFGISAYVIKLLHKSPTLTDRTVLWAELLKMKINPILGVGFESFWLGDRLDALFEALRWHPNEAHNGYLEAYLNLGLVGLFMLAGWLIATFRKIRLELLRNFEWGRFRLSFFVVVLLYNWTEASFTALHPIWFVFYIIAMDYPRPHLRTAQSSVEVARSEENREFAYAEGEP